MTMESTEPFIKMKTQKEIESTLKQCLPKRTLKMPDDGVVEKVFYFSIFNGISKEEIETVEDSLQCEFLHLSADDSWVTLYFYETPKSDRHGIN